MIELLNIDCMKYMAILPDKAFDLAIVDPPYGVYIGGAVGGAGRLVRQVKIGSKKLSCPKTYRSFDDSQIPGKIYFEELKRVSINQIIFGGNYFINHLHNTSCIIVWDKDNSGGFADAELAWTSFKTATRIFRFRWNGMLQQDMKNKETRIHPTQKPRQLYQWLLKNYAKPGQRILDTHLGSGSSAIAAHYFGCDFVGCEIDIDYFNAAKERFDRETRQIAMW